MKLQVSSGGYVPPPAPRSFYSGGPEQEPPESPFWRRLLALAFTVGTLVCGARLLLATAACSGGCAPLPAFPATPREQARATILVLAEGVREADQRCAEVGRDTLNLPLLDNCAKAYAVGRSSLLVAAGAVDAWDEGRAGETACATATGLTAALELASLIRAAGGAVPPALEDGLMLAKQFGAVCTDGGAS